MEFKLDIPRLGLHTLCPIQYEALLRPPRPAPLNPLVIPHAPSLFTLHSL